MLTRPEQQRRAPEQLPVRSFVFSALKLLIPLTAVALSCEPRRGEELLRVPGRQLAALNVWPCLTVTRRGF